MVLNGSVAVLTGAGRINGIGAAIAELLADNGCNVLLNCIKNDKQAQQVIDTCREKQVEAEIFMADMTNPISCQEMAKFVDEKWGRADILINSLGVTKSVPYEKIDELTQDDFQKIFSVNVYAPFFVTQAFKNLLLKSKDAVVINISSAAGLTGKGSSIPYAAAKGAENTLTLALAQALSPVVRVNAICPSFVDSSWWEEAFSTKKDKYESFLEGMKEKNLLKKIIKPKDIAALALSIINNPMMTGELIRVDAGAHIK